jgi:hypothetical protein
MLPASFDIPAGQHTRQGGGPRETVVVRCSPVPCGPNVAPSGYLVSRLVGGGRPLWSSAIRDRNGVPAQQLGQAFGLARFPVPARRIGSSRSGRVTK